MLPFLVQKRLCERIHLCITVYSEISRNLDQHNFRRRSRSSLIFHVEWGAEGKHTQIYQMLQGNQHPVHSNEKRTPFHQKSLKGRSIFFYWKKKLFDSVSFENAKIFCISLQKISLQSNYLWGQIYGAWGQFGNCCQNIPRGLLRSPLVRPRNSEHVFPQNS